MWTLSDNYYISWSQYQLYTRDRVEWYRRYCGDGSSFRQTLPMAVGTVFDWLVKRRLGTDLGVPSLDELVVGDTLATRCDLEAGEEVEARRLGGLLMEWYVGLGSYDSLRETLSRADSVHLDRDCTRHVWMTDSSGAEVEVRVRGLSDITWIRNGWGHIGDWKCRGTASRSGASPSQGWASSVGSRGSWPGPWIGGAAVAREERDVDGLAGYAGQLGLYGVIEGADLGFTGASGYIWELVARPTGVRVVTYEGACRFDEAAGFADMWRDVRNNSVLTDREKEELEVSDWGKQFGL